MGHCAMLNIKKILLPVDYPVATLAVLHQAATLAKHFSAEILLLHVVAPRSHEAGVPADSQGMADWDLLSAIVQQARERQDTSLEVELQGLNIQSKLVKGEVAGEILQVMQQAKADLVMMPSFGFTFSRFLLDTVTVRMPEGAEVPVWTGAHMENLPANNFAIRHVLCGVDFGPRTEFTVLWAARWAAEFGARLTLAHATASVDLWGPGGNLVDREWQEALLASATRKMAKLQHDTGVTAEVFIGSGDVPKVLSQAAGQTQADLLVTGCYPYGEHLRTNGYGIICAVPVPVLNV
jgi:nucleotide-binding universal stress UspA family protein